MADTALDALDIGTHSPSTTLWSKYYCNQFKENEMELQ